MLTVANEDNMMEVEGFSSSDSEEVLSDDDTESEVDIPSDEDEREASDIDGEDDDSMVEDEPDHVPLLAQAPYVLQPSDVITSVPGIHLQMRHCGFRICGDNIDKMIRKRFVRSDQGNVSAHYFHLYAVENSINFSELSDDIPDTSGITDLEAVARSLQPSKTDDTIFRRNISIIVSRILCTRMKFFQTCFDDIVNWHIQHRYTKEMSQKSVVVNSSFVFCTELFVCISKCEVLWKEYFNTGNEFLFCDTLCHFFNNSLLLTLIYRSH